MGQFTFTNPDLHMHSVYSDGTDTPDALLENVKKAGVDIFSLTDHDTYAGCEKLRSWLKPGDPYFVGGVELSCKDSDGKYHILGYSYDVAKPSIRDAVMLTHNARMSKLTRRIDYLKELGYSFTDYEVSALLTLKNPGKPHIASLMMHKGYVETIDQAFEIMSGYHGKEIYLSPEAAIDAIIRADGVPVLAHGILGDGSDELTEEQITARIEKLKGYGLMGAECYYSKYTEEQKEIMLSLAAKYNLLITAGSDYHGTNKPVAIGQTNSPDPEKMQRFYRAVARLIAK
ncbi:MAG: PHP domain-containing protein [Clostridia bacterium]|nr:PHP domain-containing protein [Clostridia bacterium]